MEEKITNILQILDKEDNPSQREIANKTDISLGLGKILKNPRLFNIRDELSNSTFGVQNRQWFLYVTGKKSKKVV